MGTVDLKQLVHGPSPLRDGILFDSPRSRGRYLGTENRLRAKWLSDNRDKWVPISATVEAALRAGAEYVVEPGPDHLPRLKLLSDGAEMAMPAVTGDSSSMDETAQGTPAPQPVSSSPTPPRDEILVDGRRLLSARRTAAILGKSERTLQRWHTKQYGPPRTKIGNEIFYDERKLSQWIQDH